jgi:IS5 family transposase
VRADTTVVEAQVAYPTDSRLLAKAVGTIARTMERIKAAGGAPGHGHETAACRRATGAIDRQEATTAQRSRQGRAADRGAPTQR